MKKRLHIALMGTGVLVMIQGLPMMFGFDLVQWVVVLPGTVAHEMMHWSFAVALQGEPRVPNFFPSFDAYGNMNALGSVVFRPNWYNAASVALSPLMLSGIAVWCLFHGARQRLVSSIVWCWIAATTFMAMIPSEADMNVALMHPFSFFVLIPVFLIGIGFSVRLIKREARLP